MGIKFTFTDSQPPSYFEQPGDYNITIKSCSGKIVNGNDVLTLTLEDSEGRTIKDDLFFTEKAAWRIDIVLKATGLAEGMEKGHECDLEPKLFIGRKAKVTVGWEDYEKNGEKKRVMKVKRWHVEKDDLPY